MSYKKSGLDVSNNEAIWKKNLTSFNHSLKKRRQTFKFILVSLENLSKMPKEATIVGRYMALAETLKSRKLRINEICKETIKLWQKLNFPVLSIQTVERKVLHIIEKYDIFEEAES